MSELAFDTARAVVGTMCGLVSVKVGTGYPLVEDAHESFVAVTFEDADGQTLTIGLTDEQAETLRLGLTSLLRIVAR